MEIYRGVPILIVGDDASLCKMLVDFATSIGMKPNAAKGLPATVEHVEQHHHDLVLLDVPMSVGNGLDLIPLIKQASPHALVIAMAGYTDREAAIRALRLGAFDLLEKPVVLDILSHTIARALRAIEADRKIKQLVRTIEHKNTEAKVQLAQHEALNSRLIETNKALSLLAQNIEFERYEMEKRVALKLKSLVLPVLEKLKKDQSSSTSRYELDLVMTQLEDLTSGFSTDAKLASVLSHAELRIASLIKNGLTSEKIAEHLHVSPSTIRTHRKNIRKKLKINNSQYCLRTFLSSKRSMQNPEARGFGGNAFAPTHSSPSMG